MPDDFGAALAPNFRNYVLTRFASQSEMMRLSEAAERAAVEAGEEELGKLHQSVVHGLQKADGQPYQTFSKVIGRIQRLLDHVGIKERAITLMLRGEEREGLGPLIQRLEGYSSQTLEALSQLLHEMERYDTEPPDSIPEAVGERVLNLRRALRAGVGITDQRTAAVVQDLQALLDRHGMTAQEARALLQGGDGARSLLELLIDHRDQNGAPPEPGKRSKSKKE